MRQCILYNIFGAFHLRIIIIITILYRQNCFFHIKSMRIVFCQGPKQINKIYLNQKNFKINMVQNNALNKKKQRGINIYARMECDNIYIFGCTL